MRRHHLLITILLLGLAAPAAAVDSNRFERKTSPARIEQDLRYIVEDCFPRDAGNPDNLLKAADFIRARFEEAGLAAGFLHSR